MKSVFGTALAVVLTAAVQAGAAELYVAPDGTAAAPCTLTEPCDFQTALDTARTNTEPDTIHAAAGTYAVSATLMYQPAATDDNSSLTILGSETAPTILEGGNPMNMMFDTRTYLSDDTNADITIKKTTFLHSNGPGLAVATTSAAVTVEDSNFSENSGGGVMVVSDEGSVTLIKNTVSDNSSEGAYVYTKRGNAVLNENRFSGNTSGSMGGAYAASDWGNVTLSDNVFNNNTSDSYGGGVVASSAYGNVNLTGNLFSGNTADAWGGGAYAYSKEGNVTLNDNRFSGNAATLAGGGAAAHSDNGYISLKNNRFGSNTADAGGGALAYTGGGGIALTGNQFSDNTADEYGGGIFAYTDGSGSIVWTGNRFSGNSVNQIGGGAFVLSSNGAVTLTNNMLFGNVSGNSAGGVGITGGAITLTNNTLFDNAAAVTAGGAAISSTTLDFYNNIIRDNAASQGGGDGDDLFAASDTVRLYNNDFGPDANFTSGLSEDLVIYADDYTHGGNLKDDPLFVDAAGGDLHLSDASTLIDRGDDGAPALPATDFEGDSRVIDGDGDGYAYPDIGADEYTSARPDIDIAPASLVFGNVVVSHTETADVIVTNLGDGDLTISDVAVSGPDAGAFSQSNDCGSVAPAASCTVSVTFAPLSAGAKSATLSIVSNDPDEASVDVALSGNAVTTVLDVDAIVQFIQDAVAAGTLAGQGPGKSAGNRINALINMIESVKGMLEAGDVEGACDQLSSVYKKMDGDATPPDFVTGPAVEALAGMVRELMDLLGCQGV